MDIIGYNIFINLPVNHIKNSFVSTFALVTTAIL